MESLVGQGVLGNFKLDSESENSAVLRQDASERQLPLPFLYGGDIAANVILSAATRLPALSKLKIMSVNVEYVSPGDYHANRYYHTERLRESGRFVHVLVRLMQHNRCVAIGDVTFHGDEGTAQSLSYFPPYPEDCPLPDQLESDDVLLEKYEKDPKHNGPMLNYARRSVQMLHGFGCESRPVIPEIFFRLKQEPTTRLSFWMRYRENQIPKFFDDIRSTCWSPALLAYASDFRIMGAALRQTPSYRDGKLSTLSHAMWFAPGADHQMKQPSDWMLYDTKVLMSANNTSICEGHLWSADKKLLCVTKQQALLRPKL